MEQDIKLNDGELAVVIGEAIIIMNVNTAFELVEKSKGFIGRQVLATAIILLFGISNQFDASCIESK